MTGIAHTVHKETTSTFKSLKTMVTLWEVVANGGSTVYLTIIPQARIGSESIAHEAEGRMGYWLRGHEGERNNNCFSKIQLVGQKYRE